MPMPHSTPSSIPSPKQETLSFLRAFARAYNPENPEVANKLLDFFHIKSAPAMG